MTQDEFAQKIKTKYPQYAGVDNATLTQKIVAKYPQYASQIDGASSQPAPEQGYLSRVVGAYKQAGQDITQGVERGAQALQQNDASFLGEIKTAGELLRTGLRTTGGVAGATFAPITEAPVIKQALGGVAGIITKIPGIQDVIDNADELAKRHPELAKDIKNIVDIATLASVVPTKTPGITTQGIEKTGKALQESGTVSLDKQKSDFVRQLLTPEQTKAIKEAQVSRTSETGKGIFKRSVVAPTPAQIKAEQAVSSIEGINPKATVQQNFNIIQKANTEEAIRLENAIKENDFIIPKKETLARLKQAKDSLSKSPTIVGDAQKTAQRLINGAQEFIDKNPGTGSGLLQAKKDYDQWVLSQKPKVFDASAENTFTIANREVRNAFKDLLDEKAPTIGVKQSLAKQSALYDAMDVLTPKAAQEANSAVGRALQRIGNVLGTKNKVVQATAAGVGIGGLGAAATFAPIVAGAGIPAYVVYKAGRFVLKPEIRIQLGKLLEKGAPVLDKSDRALIQGLLDQYGE